ncbi:hypothetical protein B0H14DRAFT_2591789 [Mycena olivaceomarginata]|nr:hypothetical protein B0H14DRAFT_2591789 [Mycena olivaceomarginata]
MVCKGPFLFFFMGRTSKNSETLRTSGHILTAKHAASWYEYINGSRGRGLANGELYLVTGCEKAQSWGMASYYANHENFDLAFQPVNNQYRRSGTPGKKNPSRKKGHDPPQVKPGDDQPLNHTTFIQGLSITIGTGLWSRLFGTVNVETLVHRRFTIVVDNHKWLLCRQFQPIARVLVLELFWGSTTGRKHHGQHEEVYNPAKLVNEHIIRKVLLHYGPHFLPYISHNNALRTPNATVVMSHEDGWSDMLGNHPAITDLADLLRWIDVEFAITEKDGPGATFLGRKLGYPGSSSTDDTLPLSQGTLKGNVEKKDTEANSDRDELIEGPRARAKRKDARKQT